VLRGLLTERGCLVVVGSENDGRWIGGLQRAMGAALLSPFVKQDLVMLMSSENGADLAALTAVIERGAVRPAVERTFPLDQAAAAIDHVSSGQARGKVVVTVAPTPDRELGAQVVAPATVSAPNSR
jgi:NADPH:quinone reductase-like Zn-dependent oxidoreductase